MKNRPAKVINVLRPQDTSLEAYKTWMQGIASQLAPVDKIQWTEEQWIEKWKNHWQKQERRNDESGRSNENTT